MVLEQAVAHALSLSGAPERSRPQDPTSRSRTSEGTSPDRSLDRTESTVEEEAPLGEILAVVGHLEISVG